MERQRGRKTKSKKDSGDKAKNYERGKLSERDEERGRDTGKERE